MRQVNDGREKVVYLVTGPIGAGKSTYAKKMIDYFQLSHLEYINTDIYYSLYFKNRMYKDDETYAKAKMYCEYKLNKVLETGDSFVWETVFVKTDKMEFIKKCKSQGYIIKCFFIGLEHYKNAISRVSKRHNTGWYSVPDDKVINRFQEIMKLLFFLEDISDSMITIDATNDYGKVVFLKQNGKVVYKNKDCKWIWKCKGVKEMKYKMIVLDCDGTLLNSKKVISDTTKNAIEQSVKNGMKVMLASARPFYRLRPILATMGVNVPDQYTISFNGGLVVNNIESEVILSKGFSLDLIKRIIEVGNKIGTMMFLYTRDSVLSNMDDPKYRMKNPDVAFKVCNLQEVDYSQNEIFKIAYVNKPEVTAILKTKLPEDIYAKCEISSSVPQFVEMTPKGVTKAFALDIVCKKIGINSSEIVAFGDEDNDIQMLSFAGYGIAMGNASPLVKEVSDYITASNDEDGVAVALKHLEVI